MILWLAGLFAGFVDSIAGGGGIITIPVLLAAGFDPHTALGTNKLQASFGSFTASIHYTRGKLVEPSKLAAGICFTAVGALLGTAAIQLISAEVLQMIIPGLLIAIFLYILFSPELGHIDSRAVMKKKVFFLAAGLVIGFYDGFFGPGTGSFWMTGLIVFLGYNMKKAAAHTKIMNFTSNIISLGAFIVGGKVVFIAGIVMGTAQLIGATLGSRMVLKKGTKFVRIFFLCVVAVTIAKLVYSAYIKPLL